MKKRVLYFAHELIAAFVLVSVLSAGAFAAGTWAGVAERIGGELSASLSSTRLARLKRLRRRQLTPTSGSSRGKRRIWR